MALHDDLLAPIAGENPAGADVRYEPVYDRIKEARREEEDIPQGDWSRPLKVADYALVINLADDVLATRSKDLQVAAWLTEALLRRDGFGGLRSGLTLLRGLLEQFWDHLYPEIEDDDLGMRAAPLEWVGLKLVDSVRAVRVDEAGHSYIDYSDAKRLGTEEEASSDSKKEKARAAAVAAGRPLIEAIEKEIAATPKAFYKRAVADLEACRAELAALEKVSDEKFGDEAPLYAPLRDALEEVGRPFSHILAQKLELDPDPPEPVAIEAAAETEAGADAVSAGSTPAPAAAAAGGLSTTVRSREEAAAHVAAAARYLRAQSPTDPAPYLMLRGLRWGELRARGGELDPHLLVAPPTDVRTRLKSLLLASRWAELLEAAEDVMATPYGRGWLDLQRYVVAACEGLGGGHDTVAAAVLGALRGLLQDLPRLASATLMDDSPTANGETRGWLREIGLSPAAGAAEPAAVAAGDGRAGRRAALDRALELVRAGDPTRGIELLMREAAQERSPRERFLRRAEAARLMVDAGMEAIALPMLEEMLQLLEQHKLDAWEAPETVSAALALLYRVRRKLQGDQAAGELYLRICRLDPMQAITLSAAGPNA